MFSTYAFGSINPLIQLNLPHLPPFIHAPGLLPCQGIITVFHKHSKFPYFVSSQPVMKEQTKVALGLQVGEDKFQTADVLLLTCQDRNCHIVANSLKEKKNPQLMRPM